MADKLVINDELFERFYEDCPKPNRKCLDNDHFEMVDYHVWQDYEVDEEVLKEKLYEWFDRTYPDPSVRQPPIAFMEDLLLRDDDQIDLEWMQAQLHRYVTQWSTILRNGTA